MSDYVYANKMNENGCPKCGGENRLETDYRFSCEDCEFIYG